MITTDLTPGSPCWLDLGVPDVPAAAAFYRAVLGWEFEPMGDGGGDGEETQGEGGAFRKDGKIVGGLGELTEKGARPAWMIYYTVTDADATTQAVERAGGTVRVAPRDLGDWGRMAQYSDPLGGQFAAWQPGRNEGFELADEPGSLSWTELYTTDTAAAKEFYGTVFGWRFGDMSLPGDAGTYSLVTPAGLPEERMQGGLMELRAADLTLTDGRPYWHPVFAVTDCDAGVAAVTGHGGSVQMGPEDVEGVGRLAVCLDPSNADFVLLAPAES
ncbi:VOC family protein [Streptomyces europaeiscabiei]|uniref:VOC family protein n=1 Tax=Streptomyces europaeiscabiei TaxID=146819 RepID=A0ABU4N9A2_9ACTN|nr:VOC family protein [Streptomyces europaeiscabiei]MDX2523497.1 VOC family protein [Streptomyces europaeiscabiei]MDX2765100.1 VOC family protein [Streptomyces europaeiscabiei]MDX2774647.1 VOC family protein [Streptomyces europaeiscabiei]MDX3541810.1 VOC family protein [Streptomyces europaeiscabiei]MDX3550803.1 VOC family protein [Streptomyces europaeiscabiei]